MVLITKMEDFQWDDESSSITFDTDALPLDDDVFEELLKTSMSSFTSLSPTQSRESLEFTFDHDSSDQSDAVKLEGPQEVAVEGFNRHFTVIPKKRKPLSQQAREERNRRRRVIPHIRLPFQRVRILKNDIRRSYPAMINNVINSGDARLISSFFDKFASPQLSSLNISPELSELNTVPIVYLKGVKPVSTCWVLHLQYIPDSLFLMENVIIKVNPVTNESVLVGKGTMKGTKIFEDELPPIMQTLQKVITEDQLQIIQDYDGKLQVHPKEEANQDMAIIAEQVQMILDSPFPEVVFDDCNLPKPSLVPIPFEIHGEYRVYLNSLGKMIKAEFLSQQSNSCFREVKYCPSNEEKVYL